MTLRDLEYIIDDNSSVGINVVGNHDYPIVYDWKDMKSELLPDGWDRKIHRICSNAFILIELEEEE